MATTAKNAIMKAKIEGIITELLVKTNAANVYVDDSTTLASKLSSIIADIATKASTEELTTGLAGKADKSHTHAQADVTGLADALAGKAAKSHTHAQSDITGLTDALALLASKTSVTDAIDALRQELLGDTPVEAYNTFTELAAYIAEHKEVSDALTAAVGNKADKATTLAGYGITDAYTKKEVDSDFQKWLEKEVYPLQKWKTEYTATNDAKVKALEDAKHSHSNKAVLDSITSAKVTAWDGKGKVYYSATEPADLGANDLWVQIS